MKKPRRAEVNYCPTYPSGESAETFEKIRETLLSEVRKRNNGSNDGEDLCTQKERSYS